MSDTALRPVDWDSYVGQEKLKERLQISIQGALKRGEPLDHLLLTGPPGYGKTSLAGLVAMELMEDFHPHNMPVKVKALQKILLEEPGVVFLDEIHRLPPKDQEVLLSVLEDREIHFENGQKMPIAEPMTIVAATTELRKIIKPLRDRFTHRPKFDHYTDDEMAVIVKQMATRIGLKMSDDHAKALGKASAGVPRQARTLVFTARDLGTTNPKKVMATAGITADGLTEEHVDYVRALHHVGDVAGIDKLANYTGQPKDVIVDLEQLLLRKGILDFTTKGRSLSVKGLKLVKDLT